MNSPDPPVTTPGRPPSVDPRVVASVDQTFDGDGLYSVRSTVAAHASALGASPVQVEGLVIVASELATNAVRHGGGTGRLKLWRAVDQLYCQVSDQGPGIADLSVGLQAPGQMADRGRGIWICRQLCDLLTIVNDQPGVTVTAVINLEPPTGLA